MKVLGISMGRKNERSDIYCKQVLSVMKKVPIHAMAHITGGGLVENVPRVLPEGTQVVIRRDSWKRPAVFDWLQEQGGISDSEMLRVFNNGVGMVVIVPQERADEAAAAFEAEGETVYRLGNVVAKANAGDPGCVVI